MFTRILSVSPPSSVTSKLDRAASTSSISGSLERSSGSFDKVSLQMWYWVRGRERKLLVYTSVSFIIAMVKRSTFRKQQALWSSPTWLKRLCKAGVSQRERFEHSRVCRLLHQCVGERNTDLNHRPNTLHNASWADQTEIYTQRCVTAETSPHYIRVIIGSLEWICLLRSSTSYHATFPAIQSLFLSLFLLRVSLPSLPFQFPHVPTRPPRSGLSHRTPSPEWIILPAPQDTHNPYLKLILATLNSHFGDVWSTVAGHFKSW